MKIFWVDNLNIGDSVTILQHGKKYKAVLVENKLQRHPQIKCDEKPELSGAYTFKRGCKWGTTDTWIVE